MAVRFPFRKILPRDKLPSSQFPGRAYILSHKKCDPFGDVAQLGERLNRIQEVEGSTPFVSTAEKARNTGPFCIVVKTARLVTPVPGRDAGKTLA